MTQVLFIAEDEFNFRDETVELINEVFEELGFTDIYYDMLFTDCEDYDNLDEKEFSRIRIHREIRDWSTSKVIFTLGNDVFNIVTKKSGIHKHRGSEFYVDGLPVVVVPLFHSYSVVTEPKLRDLFTQDIKNALNKFIIADKDWKTIGANFGKYKLVDSLVDLMTFDFLKNTKNVIAVDLETTGLNFKTDKITTISITYEEGKTIVIPIEHKEAKWRFTGLWNVLMGWFEEVLGNPKNQKVFHNAKFDLKFLQRYKLKVANVEDTMLMYHFMDENSPKGLKDLTKKYYPEVL